ncbi:hypothetical protein DMB38_04870 [Streptomyces sp. WAC 06738]|nr:hypothetical protein DMB38_04870 [Streptomyces sp. WAC 06738]
MIRGTFAALAAGGITVALGPVQSAEAGTVNPSPRELVVYNNNIENLVPPSCANGQDYDRFISYLKSRPLSPDIFTVQQISHSNQLAAFTRRLSDELPGTYAGRIALASPGSMGYTSPCGKLKNQQTNAVIYRSDRLTFEDETRWRSDAPSDYDAGTGPCRNLTPTRSSQDRVHNIAVRLHDNVADKDVTMASIHWPTNTWHGPECAAENINEADDAVNRLGGSLRIVAGDMNTTPGKKNWWNQARSYGFRDPIAELCGARDCSSAHDTNGSRRIDFLLARGSSGFSNAATLTEGMTGGAYSDHRAVTAHIKY